MNRFVRQELLAGERGMKQLASSKVIVFGVGGVGGICSEMMVRGGIGEITIVDFDIVDKTNINRQIIALENTIGRSKVEVLKERLLQINPHCKVNALHQRLHNENLESFNLSSYDYVIDCIDDVPAKVALIVFCHQIGAPCISAMGAGNRLGVPVFEVQDIFKTEYDRLARRLRKSLKDACIKNHLVVYSKQSLTKLQINPVGSFAPFPAVCGCTLAGFVLTKLMEEK